MGGGGWEGGKIYGTFKLFTQGAVEERRRNLISVALWGWERCGKPHWVDRDSGLPLWNEHHTNIKLIYHLSAGSAGTRKDFCSCIFLCLCWEVNVKSEQRSSLLVAGEELFMWLERSQLRGETGPALPPCCWTRDIHTTKHTHWHTPQLLVLCCSYSVCYVQTILINQSFF